MQVRPLDAFMASFMVYYIFQFEINSTALFISLKDTLLLLIQ
jgi:hypothetical protein